MSAAIDLTGKISGNLIVIARTDRKSGPHILWECRCTCQQYGCPGTVFVAAGNLNRGEHSRGCRKQRDHKYLAITAYYQITKRGAIRREYIFDLTIEEFHALIKQPCHYCGTTTDIKRLHSGGQLRFALRANGIDRVDNNRGYVIDNCIPCCHTCNDAKGTRTYQEYIDHCKRVIAYQNQRGSDD